MVSLRFNLSVTLSLALITLAAHGADKTTYQDHVLPLIQANCAKCHNEDKRKADLDLTSYAGALKGSGSGPVLVAGNPEASKLWKSITQTEDPTMPPNRPPLPDKDLEVFKKWIQGGLLENAGGKAVAAKAPQNDFTLKADSVGKPSGPPPLPQNLPREVVVHTARTSAVLGLAASPWAPVVAVAGQKQVLLFHSDTLELLGILPFTEGEPDTVRFSRSGQLLLAGGGRAAQSGRVVLWEVATGKKLMTLGDDYDAVLAADIRPDQGQVALGGPARLIKLWSTKTGELQHKLKKHTDWVTAVAYSPNGQLLATADRNGGISLWDPDSAQELFTLAGHKAAVTALSWRSDSRLLASSSEDGTVKLWETDEGKQVKSWTAHGPGTLSVNYAHTDRLVTCGRDNAVRLWDGNGKKLRELDKPGELPLSAVFSSEGNRVFASDFEGDVIAWSTESGKRAGSLDPNPAPATQKLAASQNRPPLAH
jgi:WD40 repeat protein